MHPRQLAALFIILTALSGILRGYFRGFRSSLKPLNLKPFFLLLFIFIPAVFFVMFFDQAILRWIQSGKDSYLAGIIHFGDTISRNVEFWIVLGALNLLALLSRKENLKDFAFGIFLGSALTGLIGHLLKFVFLRARPYGGFGPFSFFNIQGLTEGEHVFQSLPSGDVLLVSGASAFLFFALKNQVSRGLVFLFPLTTAVYRVAENKHWPSDTLASIGLSLIVAFFLWNHKKTRLSL